VPPLVEAIYKLKVEAAPALVSISKPLGPPNKVSYFLVPSVSFLNQRLIVKLVCHAEVSKGTCITDVFPSKLVEVEYLGLSFIV